MDVRWRICLVISRAELFDSGILEHIMNANLEDSIQYTYIVDSEGNMLYHPNKDKIGKSVENVIVKSYIQI